jgi:hypothetical protein
MNRRPAIFASIVRQIGGEVTILTGRDRVTSERYYRVHHVSRGGDVEFQSRPIVDEDRALAACEVLAQFTGSVVRR